MYSGKEEMQSLGQRYKRNENFVFRRIENETILVPIKDNVGDMGSIYNLNEVGAFVWEQLDGERTLHEIIDLITEEFDAAAREVETDLNEFVGELQEIDAIRLSLHR